MTDRTNRRDLIMNTASRMFIEQGYDATSVREIAQAVGCTEAALYYHFKGGKRALLQAVVESNMPDLMDVLKQCEQAQSLKELIRTFILEMAKLGPARLKKMRWLLAEFPHFNAGERALLHDKYLRFHDALAALIEPYVDTPEAAHEIAWLVGCAGYGYGQLFLNLGLQSVTDVSIEALTERLAGALSLEWQPDREADQGE
jgi:AcrR family transcriptional regulator